MAFLLEWGTCELPLELLVWYVCLNNNFQFFFYKNTCRWKKYIEIHVILFKNWKHVFEHVYQTDPKLNQIWSSLEQDFPYCTSSNSFKTWHYLYKIPSATNHFSNYIVNGYCQFKSHNVQHILLCACLAWIIFFHLTYLFMYGFLKYHFFRWNVFLFNLIF